MSTIISNAPAGDACPVSDELAWRAVCERAATQANAGCGLSYDYYVERFSSEIDAQVRQFPESQHATALQIAQEWGYATPAERQETRSWNSENGYCSHGIELGCCPAGCDRDDDWD